MRVRIRTDEDLDACVALAEVVHRLDGYPRYLPGSFRQFLPSAAALSAWVAVNGTTVVGHVAFHRRTSSQALALASQATGQPADRLAVIARLLVSPETRRNGIGRVLLDAVAHDAVGRGLSPVLDVVVDHHAAIALYERCSWVRAGQVTARFADGNVLEEFVYVAPLSAG